jgi:hypothetical protein
MKPGALFVVLLAALVQMSASGQSRDKLNRDPDEVKFVTSDIDNFWRAYDLAEKETERAAKVRIFQTQYLDKGSDGLKDFLRLRVKSADALVDRIAQIPKYYASIRRPTLDVAKMQKSLRASFRKFKRLYPDAVFPDVYFLIGVTNSGGTTGPSGLLIGAEMYGLTPVTPMGEVSNWLRAVLAPVKNLPAIVAHESCHYNQSLEGQKTLLAKALQEGSCDFVGELVSGSNINNHLKKYAATRHAEIWQEFRSEMNGPDISKWVYNGATSKDRPGDLGYYVGYRISEAYYRRARDKKQAVRDILNIKDIPQFLTASGYDGK